MWQSDCIALFEQHGVDLAGCKPVATEVRSRFILPYPCHPWLNFSVRSGFLLFKFMNNSG
jgi:hypothetical protein